MRSCILSIVFLVKHSIQLKMCNLQNGVKFLELVLGVAVYDSACGNICCGLFELRGAGGL